MERRKHPLGLIETDSVKTKVNGVKIVVFYGMGFWKAQEHLLKAKEEIKMAIECYWSDYDQAARDQIDILENILQKL